MEGSAQQPEQQEPESSEKPSLKKRLQEFSDRIPPWLHKLLKVFLILFGAGLLLVLAFIIRIYHEVPTHDELKIIENYTATEVYSSDNVLIGKYFLQDRTNVSYNEIAPHVIDALVATEDARFYEHKGVDRKSMLRVLVKSIILNERSAGGGSTISQQLAKNLFPREGSGIINLAINKTREIITAWKLERIYSKEEILTFYLNTVSFGENAFGIHTAALRFFNKHPSTLSIEEGATLIGMLKAPTTYNPRRNPERSLERRNLVLDRMVEYDYLALAAADSIRTLPIELDYTFRTHNEGIAPYFREHLRQELEAWCEENRKPDGTPYNLYVDGLKIHTTINSKMQMHAEVAVKESMKALQRTFNSHWGRSNPWGRSNEPVMAAVRRSERYRLLKNEGLGEDEIMANFREKVPVTLYTLEGEKTDTITPLDSVKYYMRFLHAGFMAVEAGSGHVLAWVGGINHKFFKYDHVNINAKRQVGSTFKPIVYAAALNAGVEPCEYFQNERQTYEEWQDWSPRNADGQYGGEYSMEGALTNSVNTVSAQLIMRAGINRVIDLARKMGITSPLDPVPSLALGTADISLYEMVGAYTTFANNGVHTTPVYIDRIEDKDGRVIHNPGREKSFNQALSPNRAAVMTHMLEGVVDDGTASRIRWSYGISGDVAGKTGTTQNQSDGWFIGYTPRIIAGAWVGADDRRVHFRSLSLGQGARTALPIWGAFMASIKKDTSLQHFLGGNFDEPDDWMMTELDCEPYRAAPPDTTFFLEDWYYDVRDFLSDPFRRDSNKVQERQERRQERIERREERARQRQEERNKKKEEESSEENSGDDPVIITRPIQPAEEESDGTGD